MADKVCVVGVCIAVLAMTAAATLYSEMRLGSKYSLLRMQYLLMFTLLMTLLSLYIWNTLAVLAPRPADSAYSRGCVWLYRLVLLAFLVLADLSFPIGHYFVATEPYLISRLAFLCLGLKILLLTNLVVLSLLRAIISRISLRLSNRFNMKVKAAVATALSLLMCFHGLQTASCLPGIVQVTVPLAKLPVSLNGTKIVQLSDIHLGPSVGRAMLERVVDVVLLEDPDIIVVTGDVVDFNVETLGSAVQPMKRLQARYGTYFVTGNHEYFTGDVDAWLQKLEDLGIKCLHNSHALIRSAANKQDRIFLAGVDDIVADSLKYKGHGLKLAAALDGYDSKHTTILLAHQPRSAKQALSQYPNIDLILCGHTHGGDFFPVHIPVYLENPFFAGLYNYNSTFVYVSSGTFYYNVPLRLGSTPEITIITLVMS